MGDAGQPRDSSSFQIALAKNFQTIPGFRGAYEISVANTLSPLDVLRRTQPIPTYFLKYAKDILAKDFAREKIYSAACWSPARHIGCGMRRGKWIFERRPISFI